MHVFANQVTYCDCSIREYRSILCAQYAGIIIMPFIIYIYGRKVGGLLLTLPPPPPLEPALQNTESSE